MQSMIAFVVGLVLLVAGYVVYGRIVTATVRPDPNRVTPAIALADGGDYVPMSTWRVYLVQLLNIAGLGPVVRLRRVWAQCLAQETLESQGGA